MVGAGRRVDARADQHHAVDGAERGDHHQDAGETAADVAHRRFDDVGRRGARRAGALETDADEVGDVHRQVDGGHAEHAADERRAAELRRRSRTSAATNAASFQPP